MGTDESPAVQVEPAFSWRSIYDSNVFATDSDTIDDWINVFEPQLRLTQETRQTTSELDLGAELGRYAEQSRENYDDYWISFDVRKNLSSKTRIFSGIEYNADHEGRDSPDSNLSGTSPTTFDSRIAQLGLLHKTERAQLRLGGTYENRRFDDVSSAGGKLINSDRDREHYGLGMRVSQSVTSTTSLFLHGLYDQRDYRKSRDQNGFVRDSYGYRAAAGIKHGSHASLLIEAYIGGLKQKYQDARFSDETTIDFGAQINWRIRPATRFNVAITRSLEETTEPGSAGYLITEIDLKLHQRHQGKLSTHINGYYGYLDYLGIPRSDRLTGIGGTIKYPLSSVFSVAANYSWIHRDTSGVTAAAPAADQDFDYQRHTLSLTLTGQLR